MSPADQVGGRLAASQPRSAAVSGNPMGDQAGNFA
jgi:hypothetical protein